MHILKLVCLYLTIIIGQLSEELLFGIQVSKLSLMSIKLDRFGNFGIKALFMLNTNCDNSAGTFPAATMILYKNQLTF